MPSSYVKLHPSLAPRAQRTWLPQRGWLPLALLAALANPTAAQQATELPGIVVVGATLDVKPPRPAASAAAPVGAAVGEAGPAPVTTGDGGAAAGNVANAPQSAVDGVPIDRIGSSVTVVTRQDLERRQIRHAGDALRSLPGVSVARTDGFAGLTQVRIRGNEGNQTLVLIDGIRANDTTNGEFDFSDLLAEDIERIEIIRGPQSGLYGAGAVGGVVNIVTRGGRGPLTVALAGEAGSFRTGQVAARVSGGTDKAWGAISLTQRRTDGFNIAPLGSEEDDARQSSLSIKAGAALLAGVTIDLSVRNNHKRGGYDDFGGPAGRLATAVDAPNRLNHNIWLAGGRLTWEALDGRLTQQLRASYNSTQRTNWRPVDLGVNDSTTAHLAYSATLRLDTPALLGSRHYFTGLGERERETFTPLSDFGFGATADGIARERGLMAGALEYRGEFLERLFLAATVRRDDHDSFPDYDTWRATATVKLTELGLRPHASIGTGVKLPTMFEQFGALPQFFTPNPRLRPERFEGWDAGVEATLLAGRLVLDATYFSSEARDKINGLAPGPNFTFTAVNLPGISTREGIELSARLALTPDLALSGAYTHLDARTPDGLTELRRPRRTGKAELAYSIEGGRGQVSVGAVYNGVVEDNLFLMVDPFGFGPFPQLIGRSRLDPYWLVTVAGSYKLKPGLEVFGRVENVLDQQHQEVFGYEGPGVAAYAGFRLTLEEPSTAAWARFR
jgi:vitamin B12 transporter